MNYTLTDAVRRDLLPFGKFKAYEEIAAGRLKARKAGRSTILSEEDIRAYIAGLPVIEPKKAA